MTQPNDYKTMNAAQYSAWLANGGNRAVSAPLQGELIVPSHDLVTPTRPSVKAVTSLGPWGTGVSLSTMQNTDQAKAAAYLKAYSVGWFHKAGAKISGDFANLPWHISDGDIESDDPNEATLPKPDLTIPFDQLDPIDQLQRLMEKPNPYYSGRVLRQKSWIRHKFGGLAILYLENGDFGLPTAIYGISPARMWPSYAKNGTLIGWVMDAESPSGGTPFSTKEIVAWSAGGPDDSPFGVSVVEAIYSQVPLTDLMARHTGNVLTTGGRLAGMMWPKERSLSEDEFVDAQRAWRSIASDHDAAKRLLIFPEPMEYAQGASTPAEIGIPELAILNRDEVLTGFNLSPYRLGVPAPGGLNSGEVRREDRRDYWEDAVGPEVTTWDEVINTYIVSRYEEVLGRSFVYTTEQPNLDDAPTLLEKVSALRALAAAGFEEREAVKAVGLQHIKFSGIPIEPDPNLSATVGDTSRLDGSQTQSTVIKPKTPAAKSRDDVVSAHEPAVASFLAGQRERVIAAIRSTYPQAKARRAAWSTKDDPEWWDVTGEDARLREVVAKLYVDAGRSSLQVVADSLGRIVPNKAIDRVVDDLMTYGGERIRDINARTLQSITIELAEGARRGYTINQLIDGVAAEGYKGVLNVGLDNGVGVWGDARAETIARTETALSYNRAALDAYKEFRVARVLAYDGDGDPECAARNGREFSVDDAFSIADHPNGTLDWAPVVDKSYHEPQPTVVIHNHMEPTKAADVRVDAPIVHNHYKAPDVTVNTPAVSVSVPEQPTPNVTVLPPVVNVRQDAQKAPVVNVKAPVVNVPAPIVNIPVELKADIPPEVRVVSLPPRMHDIQRDKQGKPTGSVETDI